MKNANNEKFRSTRSTTLRVCYYSTLLRGEQWEKVGNWSQGEKRGRVSGVLSAPLSLLAQEDPYKEVIFTPQC
eukprot:1196202-Prorocentrum_minimum.AAC.3